MVSLVIKSLMLTLNLKSVIDMKKFMIIKVVKLILKHILPLVLAYLEGDSHMIEDTIINFM